MTLFYQLLLDRARKVGYTFIEIITLPSPYDVPERREVFLTQIMDTTNQKPVLLTKDGMEELKAEFDELTKVKRPAAVRRLADARDLGDLSENSEYAAAKQDLAFIDGRIAELEEIIHGAKVVTNHTRQHIDIGCKVTLHLNGKKDVYTVVGEWEADPKEKKISHESPLGKALMGKKVGEIAEVEAPAGKVVYQVLSIE